MWEAAACATEAPDLFFDPEREAEAKTVCGRCPVRTQCLQTNFEEDTGVFGGTTPEERLALGGGQGIPTPEFRVNQWGYLIDGGVSSDDASRKWGYRPEGTGRGIPERSTNRVDADKLRDMYTAGYSWRDMADAFEVSDTTIGRYIRELGLSKSDISVAVRKDRLKTKNADRDKLIIELYSKKLYGLHKIAKEVKCSKRTVVTVVREAGVIRDPEAVLAARRRAAVRRPSTDPVTTAIVVHLKEGKLKPPEIARLVDVNVYRVYNLRKSVRKGFY